MKFLLNNLKTDSDLFYLKDEIIQKDLCERLNKTKTLIDEYPKEWEFAKKHIHDYEYIYYFTIISFIIFTYDIFL